MYGVCLQKSLQESHQHEEVQDAEENEQEQKRIRRHCHRLCVKPARLYASIGSMAVVLDYSSCCLSVAVGACWSVFQ